MHMMLQNALHLRVDDQMYQCERNFVADLFAMDIATYTSSVSS
jgi:hypothetical protein